MTDGHRTDGQRLTVSDHNSSLSTPCSGELKICSKKSFQTNKYPVLNLIPEWTGEKGKEENHQTSVSPAVCLFLCPQKAFTLAIREWYATELSYFTFVFLVVRSFLRCKG